MSGETSHTFGPGAKAMHWAVFALFASQFVLARTMLSLERDGSAFGMGKFELFGLHKSVGMLILVLALARITWRITTRLPNWAQPLSAREIRFVHFVEYGMYAVMVVMPLSGYLSSLGRGRAPSFFGLFEFPMLMAKNKVGFVMKRTVGDKDRFVNRMLPFKRQ